MRQINEIPVEKAGELEAQDNNREHLAQGLSSFEDGGFGDKIEFVTQEAATEVAESEVKLEEIGAAPEDFAVAREAAATFKDEAETAYADRQKAIEETLGADAQEYLTTTNKTSFQELWEKGLSKGKELLGKGKNEVIKVGKRAVKSAVSKANDLAQKGIDAIENRPTDEEKVEAKPVRKPRSITPKKEPVHFKSTAETADEAALAIAREKLNKKRTGTKIPVTGPEKTTDDSVTVTTFEAPKRRKKSAPETKSAPVEEKATYDVKPAPKTSETVPFFAPIPEVVSDDSEIGVKPEIVSEPKMKVEAETFGPPAPPAEKEAGFLRRKINEKIDSHRHESLRNRLQIHDERMVEIKEELQSIKAQREGFEAMTKNIVSPKAESKIAALNIREERLLKEKSEKGTRMEKYQEERKPLIERLAKGIDKEIEPLKKQMEAILLKKGELARSIGEMQGKVAEHERAMAVITSSFWNKIKYRRERKDIGKQIKAYKDLISHSQEMLDRFDDHYGEPIRRLDQLKKKKTDIENLGRPRRIPTAS